MATTWRGRSASSSRSPYGAFASYSTQPAWGKWGKSSSSSSTRRSSSVGKWRKAGSSSSPSSAYRSVSNQFQLKINSFKTLINQTFGPAKFGRPTPTLLNTFANWVNNGAIVQTVSATQVARWARLKNKSFNSRNPTISSAKTVLSARFGKSTIKAVARAKNGSFLVATASTWQGRPFSFPH